MNDTQTTEIADAIEQSNQKMKELYPTGQQHSGIKLKNYSLNGFQIYAINADQALNIYHQTKVDTGNI